VSCLMTLRSPRDFTCSPYVALLRSFIIRSTYISSDTSLVDGLIYPSNGPLSLAMVCYKWKFPGLLSVLVLL